MSSTIRTKGLAVVVCTAAALVGTTSMAGASTPAVAAKQWVTKFCQAVAANETKNAAAAAPHNQKISATDSQNPDLKVIQSELVAIMQGTIKNDKALKKTFASLGTPDGKGSAKVVSLLAKGLEMTLTFDNAYLASYRGLPTDSVEAFVAARKDANAKANSLADAFLATFAQAQAAAPDTLRKTYDKAPACTKVKYFPGLGAVTNPQYLEPISTANSALDASQKQFAAIESSPEGYPTDFYATSAASLAPLADAVVAAIDQAGTPPPALKQRLATLRKAATALADAYRGQAGACGDLTDECFGWVSDKTASAKDAYSSAAGATGLR